MPSSTNAQKKLGKAIRAGRLALDYSQDGFAHECGLHRTYMGAVERGEKNISLNNIVKIATALDIPAATLLERAHL